MAKFVLVGRVDCIEYARAEMLADHLRSKLAHFDIHKIPVESSEWSSWLSEACSERGWQFEGPVLIWRELIDRGGKGLILGGLKEFEEYAKHYYDVVLDVPEEIYTQIASENTSSLEQRLFDEKRKQQDPPTVICITNASHPLAYHLAHQIGCSGLYSDEGGIELRFLSSSEDVEATEGVCMEVEDLALPHIKSVKLCSGVKDAFTNVHIVFLLDYHDSLPEDSEDSQLQLKEAVVRFHNYARVLDFRGNKSVRVIFSGRYAEIGVRVFAETAASLETSNFVAPSNLAAQQAKSILATKLGINPANVKNVIMWGSTSADSLHADLTQSKVHNYAGSILGPSWFSRAITECILDHDWLKHDFPTILKQRRSGAGYRDGSPVVSEAVVLAQFLKQWTEGTQEILSTAMYIEESCSLCPDVLTPKIVLSLPCVVKEGKLTLPDNLRDISEEIKDVLTRSADSLQKDFKFVSEVIQNNTPCSP